MRRFTTSIAIIAMAWGGFALYGGAVASAAGVLVVTPSTGLTNGQVVAVSGTGFTANDSVFVIECLATTTPTTQQCNIATATPATVSATGTVTANFTVVTGTIFGTTTCGTNSTDSSNCIVAVGNATGGDSAGAPITFAVPVAATTTTTPPKIGPRKFHASPVTGLRNRSKVHVSGTGFKPGDLVYVVECLTNVKNQAQCDLKTLKPVKITAKGVLPGFTFTVVTGKIGTGTCGTKASNLKSCAISVGNASKGDSALARITFKL